MITRTPELHEITQNFNPINPTIKRLAPKNQNTLNDIAKPINKLKNNNIAIIIM